MKGESSFTDMQQVQVEGEIDLEKGGRICAILDGQVIKGKKQAPLNQELCQELPPTVLAP